MTSTASPLERERVETDSPPRRTLAIAVLLVSFSALLLELSLTRLFSVVLFYHFAFLAISIALLGLGVGGVFAYIRKQWLQQFSLATIGTTVCLFNSLVIVAVLWIVLHSNVSLEFTARNFLLLTRVYLVSAIPFFGVGVLFSVLFARHTKWITQLYGADLAGGALACLATVPFLNSQGAPNTILFAAVAVAAAAMLWTGQRRRSLYRAGTIAFLLLLIIVGNRHGRLFDIVYAKGMYRDPAMVEFAKWNSISRVEVDKQDHARAIVIDADASTYIMNVAPEHWEETEMKHHLMSAAASSVNVLRPNGDFAIIGPGGGVDVLTALANGSKNVTGIEINPIIATDIMRGKYADYSHHLYSRPDVHIHVSDGRSFIRNSHDKYDVVQMTLVDTWASTAAGAFALSENNLYTVEAFREYFEHLKPDGIVAITRWEFKHPREALRVVSNEVEVLHQLGVSDASKHFIIVSDGQLDTDGRPVLVMAKRTPFTRDEEWQVLQHLEEYKNLVLIYSPSDHTRPAGVHPVDPRLRWNPFTALLISNDPRGFAEKYAYNVSPVTDNAPFFFFTLKLGQVLHPSPLDRGIDWKNSLGVVSLLILLCVSFAAVLAFLVAPMALHAPAKSESLPRLLYFVAIGLGYILAEIALIQRFVLFLGHPTYALTVVIFLMLLSSGAGSLLSRRWLAAPRRVWKVALGIAGCMLVYVFALPGLLRALVGIPFMMKLVVSGVLILPLGLMMGVPFPTGLRALRIQGSESGSVEWAWALNAASSVLGSVLAMVVAIQWGLAVTLACGALSYLLASILTRSFYEVRL